MGRGGLPAWMRLEPQRVSQHKLASLLQELREHRAQDAPEREEAFQACVEETELAADRLCLVHGVVDEPVMHSILSAGALKRRAELGLPPTVAEEAWGLSSAVYLGVGRLHPNRRYALAFRSRVEDSVPVEASPWDTGSFYRWYRRGRAAGMAKGFCERHTLPAPYYRRYLAHYVASCFAGLSGYLEGTQHRWADPLGALDAGKEVLRCFEARSGEEIPLDPGYLAAVFVRRAASLERESEPFWEALERLRESDVEIVRYAGSMTVAQREVVVWQMDRLPRTERSAWL